MKILTRVALALILFASAGLIARADSVGVSSSGPSDFKIILNDPSCPSGTTCVNLGYDGTTPLGALLFLAPNPIQIPAGQTAACSTNFGACIIAPGDGDGDRDDYFFGVLFIGIINPGQDLTIGLSGDVSNFSLVLPQGIDCPTCTNGIINFATTPEPSTILLLIGGLVFFGVFLRRRSAVAVTSA